MAAPTYFLIASNTVGSGGVASFTFSGIPQTYTDLVIKMSARNTTDVADVTLSFNGVTTNRSDRVLYGLGGSAGSFSDASTIYAPVGRSSYTTNTFSNNEFYIPNYTSSNYKSISQDSVTENNSAGAILYLAVGLWSSTAAITSITITPASGLFTQYSTFTLYGISNA